MTTVRELGVAKKSISQAKVVTESERADVLAKAA